VGRVKRSPPKPKAPLFHTNSLQRPLDFVRPEGEEYPTQKPIPIPIIQIAIGIERKRLPSQKAHQYCHSEFL